MLYATGLTEEDMDKPQVGVASTGESDAESACLLDELEELVASLQIAIVGKEQVRLRQPQARFLLGTGKVDKILKNARACEAD
ncbi:MAG: hypothetical protein ACO20W_09190, partial [Anaerohalosphaeraceae bacterium]